MLPREAPRHGSESNPITRLANRPHLQRDINSLDIQLLRMLSLRESGLGTNPFVHLGLRHSHARERGVRGRDVTPGRVNKTSFWNTIDATTTIH